MAKSCHDSAVEDLLELREIELTVSPVEQLRRLTLFQDDVALMEHPIPELTYQRPGSGSRTVGGMTRELDRVPIDLAFPLPKLQNVRPGVLVVLSIISVPSYSRHTWQYCLRPELEAC